MCPDALHDKKSSVRQIGLLYVDRFDRARRLFIEERTSALCDERSIEYKIRSEISNFFGINYSSVCFTGSAQLGFSITKNKIFKKGISDLDVACVDVNLFQKSWADIIESTKAFTNYTSFSEMDGNDIELFKQSILRRGMIRVELMPKSRLSASWKKFEEEKSREYREFFGKITVAIYMNEYAFCWKQDSALTKLLDR